MKPFLKWAGNKYQIVDTIRKYLPRGGRLIEPFVGSGAVFLNLYYPAYFLADANPDLITLFNHVRDDGEPFVDYCRSYFVPGNNEADAFYALRERFNSTADLTEKSALFLYLNKHCYNGLCRYNLSGEFNAPFGRYKKPYFPAHEMRYFRNRSETATFACIGFREAMGTAVPGDVVYCDPPYVPLSETANFTSYNTGGFSTDDQAALAAAARALAERGVPVVISNHDTEFTRDAYAGAEIVSFDVQRYISCNGSKRGKARELLAIFRPEPSLPKERPALAYATPLQPLA
jgi:DNA adenine methylase